MCKEEKRAQDKGRAWGLACPKPYLAKLCFQEPGWHASAFSRSAGRLDFSGVEVAYLTHFGVYPRYLNKEGTLITTLAMHSWNGDMHFDLAFNRRDQKCVRGWAGLAGCLHQVEAAQSAHQSEMCASGGKFARRRRYFARQKKMCALCSALCFTCTHSWMHVSTTTNLRAHICREKAP